MDRQKLVKVTTAIGFALGSHLATIISILIGLPVYNSLILTLMFLFYGLYLVMQDDNK